MKDKVHRFAKGEFEYESPKILVSEEEIQFSVVLGQTYSNSFVIKNSKNVPMKGLIYSACGFMELQQDSFTDRENTIHYIFHANSLECGETVNGYFSIVSDCGECKICFTATVEAPYFNTSLGKIKDLFSFTNLAKADHAQALKIFKSDQFQQVILHDDSKYIMMYRKLLKSRSVSHGMEEFLISARKKLKVNFSVDKTNLNYEASSDSFMDKIAITKDTWGYSEIRVSTDASFISLEHKIIWTDNFIGNTYQLEFVIQPKSIHKGNHYGRICLKTTYQLIVVEVFLRCNKSDEIEENNYRLIKESKFNLTKIYLKFRRNNITLKEYLNETSELLKILRSKDIQNDVFYSLIQLHFDITSGNDTEVTVKLEEIKDQVTKVAEMEPLNYCIYLYLKAYLNKDEASIHEAIEVIRNTYERGSNPPSGKKNLASRGQASEIKKKAEKTSYDFKLIWLLLNLDSRYDNNSVKIKDLKNQFMEGCRSPYLYYEAAYVFNNDPTLLIELDSFLLQVFSFACKYEYITEKTALRYTYLASKIKNFNQIVYHCLVKVYEMYSLKDTLIVICSLLIKGNKRDNKYFPWFKKGIEEQLRVTQLYEYYIYSLDMQGDIVLPQSILLYFIYNSNISNRKKAYLYAYIITKKDLFPSIYHSYYKHIEKFALQQLVEHNINNDLAVIYEEVLSANNITADIAKELPFIMFKYEIFCNNQNIKGIYVAHKERNEEVYYPFVNGSTQIDLYTEDGQLLLVDGNDNRYCTTIEYTLQKINFREDLISKCYELQVDHPMFLLHLCDKATNYRQFNDLSLDLRKKVMGISDLCDSYINKIQLELTYYYYDNFHGEQLDSYLNQIDFKDLKDFSKTDRNKVIELYIIRDMTTKALSALVEYGYEEIAINRLIKLCTRVEEDGNSTLIPKKDFVNLFFFVFKQGKYNEAILNFLVKNYLGTTYDMYSIFEVAVSYGVDCAELAEKLLAQMIFSECYVTNSFLVFIHFYKRNENSNIIKAYLTYNAYKYLVKDRILQPEMFDILRKMVTYEENDICMLAVLKEMSLKDNLSEDDKIFAEINIQRFVKKGVILPFFMDFSWNIDLPLSLHNKYIVEYKTNPEHKVYIHYRMEGKNPKEEFVQEEMKNVYPGIFVKEFTLFFNEIIQYYITEEDKEGQVSITESKNLYMDQLKELEADTRYNAINYILTALSMQDENTLIECIINYNKTSYMISQLFKPI